MQYSKQQIVGYLVAPRLWNLAQPPAVRLIVNPLSQDPDQVISAALWLYPEEIEKSLVVNRYRGQKCEFNQ